MASKLCLFDTTKERTYQKAIQVDRIDAGDILLNVNFNNDGGHEHYLTLAGSLFLQALSNLVNHQEISTPTETGGSTYHSHNIFRFDEVFI